MLQQLLCRRCTRRQGKTTPKTTRMGFRFEEAQGWSVLTLEGLEEELVVSLYLVHPGLRLGAAVLDRLGLFPLPLLWRHPHAVLCVVLAAAASSAASSPVSGLLLLCSRLRRRLGYNTAGFATRITARKPTPYSWPAGAKITLYI